MTAMEIDADYDWGLTPQLCSKRIDSDRGELRCTGWAHHYPESGHTFEATSQPQDSKRDTEARQEAQR